MSREDYILTNGEKCLHSIFDDKGVVNKYAKINYFEILNGEGIGNTLFLQGCSNGCKACYNKSTWDFNAGNEFTQEVFDEVINALNHEYITGLSLLGGEPFEKSNQEALLSLCLRVKNELKNRDIWAYTGFLYEDLLCNGKRHFEVTDRLLNCIDILIDGKFIENLKNIDLNFRGSENQRLIHLH